MSSELEAPPRARCIFGGAWAIAVDGEQFVNLD
jgi:hypothetical protein